MMTKIACFMILERKSRGHRANTDLLFRYALPCIWNQLPDLFRQPNQPRLDSPPHSLVNRLSPLSASITLSLHSQTYLFNKSFSP